MTTNDSAIDDYYALRPVDYGFLELFELRQETNTNQWSGLTARLQLRPAGTSEHALILQFTGVQNLKIGPINGLLRYYCEVRSLRDRQLDHIHYHVVESECNAFSFLCNEFCDQVKSAAMSISMLFVVGCPVMNYTASLDSRYHQWVMVWFMACGRQDK